MDGDVYLGRLPHARREIFGAALIGQAAHLDPEPAAGPHGGDGHEGGPRQRDHTPGGHRLANGQAGAGGHGGVGDVDEDPDADDGTGDERLHGDWGLAGGS